MNWEKFEALWKALWDYLYKVFAYLEGDKAEADDELREEITIF